MYRIELSPGEETVFRSIEELAVAIKRGVVTPRARIYHNASSKWLPIQFHPHYKTAASMPLTSAALVAGPPVKALSTLKLDQPSEPDPIAPPLPTSASLESTGSKPGEKSSRKTKASPESSAKRRRRASAKPRRQLRIALVGALLIGGAQWVLSAPLFSRADAPVLLRAHRQLISVPTEAMNRVSSPNSAGMVPVIADSPAATAPLDQLSDNTGPTVPSFGGTSVAVPDIAAEVDPTAPQINVTSSPGRDSARSGSVDSTQSRALKGSRR
ncbi:MAG TPA: hypothetical protein VHH32_08905 [Gemmatimonadales bacterium]|nr:hypothetical protein [Gemmatimonadales bacterium]